MITQVNLDSLINIFHNTIKCFIRYLKAYPQGLLGGTLFIFLGVYEIIIGGFGNTKTWIRNTTYGENLAFGDTPDILSPDEYRPFWIKWENGLVEVSFKNCHFNSSKVLAKV